MVVVKSDEGNKAQWKLQIITEVYLGTDGKVKAVMLRAGKSYLEPAIQYLHLKLSCEITATTKEHTMNEEAEEFGPRKMPVKLHEQESTVSKTMKEKCTSMSSI